MYFTDFKNHFIYNSLHSKNTEKVLSYYVIRKQYHYQSYDHPILPSKCEIKAGTWFTTWTDYRIDKVEFKNGELNVYSTKGKLNKARKNTCYKKGKINMQNCGNCLLGKIKFIATRNGTKQYIECPYEDDLYKDTSDRCNHEDKMNVYEKILPVQENLSWQPSILTNRTYCR